MFLNQCSKDKTSNGRVWQGLVDLAEGRYKYRTDTTTVPFLLLLNDWLIHCTRLLVLSLNLLLIPSECSSNCYHYPFPHSLPLLQLCSSWEICWRRFLASMKRRGGYLWLWWRLLFLEMFLLVFVITAKRNSMKEGF